MAKQSAKATNPTPEEVVAQNGGLENATPVTENVAEVEEVTEEVVTENVAKEVVEEPVAPKKEATKETAKAPEVEEEVTAPVVETAEKTMECLGLKKHTCRIGGSVINIAKDKVQTLPVGVATVLQRAGVVIVK